MRVQIASCPFLRRREPPDQSVIMYASNCGMSLVRQASSMLPPLCEEGGDTSQPSGYTASFSSLAARNATFLLALILIASPVAGLRPIRAGRFLT